MFIFSLAVFAVHTLFELAFGLNAYLTGASSSQSAEEAAKQSPQATISARFLGSALLALGVLGAMVVLHAGVLSPTAKYLSLGFAVFHALGALGILKAASSDRSVLARPLTMGALVTHGVLAVGFILIALLMTPVI